MSIVTADNLLAKAAEAADRLQWETAADLLADGPPTDDLLDKRGWYSSRAKRHDAAIADYEILRSRRPNDYLPPYMIGYQFYQQERWADALPYFDEAIRRRPDHIKTLWRRAQALHKLGREVQAVAAAGKVLRAWSALPADKQDEDRRRYAQACHLIGRYQAKRDPAGAVDLLRAASANEPSDPYHHYQLAKSLRLLGWHKEALESVKAARQLKRGDTNIEVEYADALIALGRQVDGARCLQAVRRQCSGWVAYRAGKLAMQAGDARLAVTLLERATLVHAVAQDVRVQEVLASARETAAGVATPVEIIEESRDSNVDGRKRRQRRPSRHSPKPAEPDSPAGTTLLGTVDIVRDDRNFGFLVDDEGVRRHFRLWPEHGLHKGDRVRFVAASATKGPAARELKAV